MRPHLVLGAKEWLALWARVAQYLQYSTVQYSTVLGGAVLVQPPHVPGDVQVKLGAEVDLQQSISWVQSTQSVVDLVVRPLLVQAGHHPGAIQDGHQVP